MATGTRDAMLSCAVELDGAAFGGHVRPANACEDRIDRRLLEHRSGKCASPWPCGSEAGER